MTRTPLFDDLDLRADEFDAAALLDVGMFDQHRAWDCWLFMVHDEEGYALDLDETDDTGDWQVLVLDRFGDRSVTA